MPSVSQAVRVGGYELQLTNLDKLLWPESGYSKADYIAYMSDVSPYLLPYLEERPLVVTRYPDGIPGKFFYQKNCPAYAPDWIQTYETYSKAREGSIRYIIAANRATLIWLANQGAIEMNPWHSTKARPHFPTYAIFDLDPAAGATFEDVIDIAGLVKTALDELNIRSYPKLSGATGIHIYVPLEPRYAYRLVSAFVARIGALIVAAYPKKATNERMVANRAGRVYIDHLQNLPGKTIVAPYSVRPLTGAPVSMPIGWEELPFVRPGDFTIKTSMQRLLTHGDQFAEVLTRPQCIDHVTPLIEDWMAGKPEWRRYLQGVQW